MEPEASCPAETGSAPPRAQKAEQEPSPWERRLRRKEEAKLDAESDSEPIVEILSCTITEGTKCRVEELTAALWVKWEDPRTPTNNGPLVILSVMGPIRRHPALAHHLLSTSILLAPRGVVSVAILI